MTQTAPVVADKSLAADRRESRGKGAARKLRARGRIPAVVYGGSDRATRAVSTDPLALERLIARSEAGMNTLIDLSISGDGRAQKKLVLIKELQRDPVRGDLLHADFYEVDLGHAIEVSVPLHLVGTPRGVSVDGGILDPHLRELDVECLPRAIPDSIDLDVSELELGETIHVSDLRVPEGVEVRSDPQLAVVSVVAPRAAAEEAAAEEEAAPEEAAPAAGEEAAPAEPEEGGGE